MTALRPCSTHCLPGAHRHSERECQDHPRRRSERQPIAPNEFPQAVPPIGRTRQHHVVVQVTQDIHRQPVGGLVTAVAVLFQRFHHDPIQIAPQQLGQAGGVGLPAVRYVREALDGKGRQASRGPRRVLLTHRLEDLVDGGLSQFRRFKGGLGSQKLVKQHAKRIDISPRINVLPAKTGLLGTHVGGCGGKLLVGRDDGFLGEAPLQRRFGDAEVDHFGHRLAILLGHENIRRLNVLMDDTLKVGVLDRLAHLREQPQPFPDREVMLVAVIGNFGPIDILHDEIRAASVGFARVEDSSDVGVIHHGQGLPLAVEARNHLARIHPDLNYLEGDPATDWFFLFGEEYYSKTARANLLDQPVAADPLPGFHRRTLSANAGTDLL
ncbi:hypothetical protein SBV1_2010032 [Verrucomicrobia bacterium]|nr:hypothetical protein SBV1_2010032 [Verrucomicrobiota bacterium]